jgi:hypothetical protein
LVESSLAMAIVVGTYSDYKGIYLFPVLKIYNTD